MKNPIETCNTFLGISWRCTNDLHCLWIGISPKGLGLLLKSLQLQPDFALVGDRCPFVAFPFVLLVSSGRSLSVGLGDFFAALTVEVADFRRLRGLRLLVLDLSNSIAESSGSVSPSSIPSSMGSVCADNLFLADLVIGPKYSPLWDNSDGVGEGDMTRGVAGISENDLDIAKSGKQGTGITPASGRRPKAKTRNREMVESRCWSFREERSLSL